MIIPISLIFFFTENLAEMLENFEVDWEGIYDDIVSEIEEKVDQALEYAEDLDWDTVEAVAEDLYDEAEEFAYDVMDQVTRGLTNEEYVFDEFGNR